ncbi:MAG: CPBP family intramembrane metalloprotease [Eubacteriales bacterium]|nr:CPBP family intramembrane metalloprotease [Eubacteriales bacterium]
MIEEIKKYLKKISWIFVPFFWYIVGVVITEQLLYGLFLLSVKYFFDSEAYYPVFKFIVANRYVLFPMISGIILTSFFIRLYREDWKLRVRKDGDRYLFNTTEIGGKDKKNIKVQFEEMTGLGFGLLSSMALCILLTFGINFFAGAASLDQAVAEASKLKMSDIYMFIPASLLVAPVFEELFFRGILFRRARDRFGFWNAAIISSLVFGIVHENTAQMLFAFIMGLLFAYTYERYEALLPAVLMHMSANLMSFVISMGIFDSLYMEKGILFYCMILICSSVTLYGIYKLGKNKIKEYVLFSSTEKED